MEAKGTTLISTREFVKISFGDESVKNWVDSLSNNGKKIYNSEIMPDKWYPLKESLTDPTRKLCGMFYKGDTKGAREAGKFSAETGLKGIYRFFVQRGSPEFIIKKASVILPAYYKPSAMRAGEIGPNGAVVEITDFKEISDVVEARIAGWIERALEISGCSNINVAFIKSLIRGDKCTQFVIKWDN